LGVAIVGTILAVGKNVGFRKIGERAGVYFPNVNRGENITGFASHLQVDSSRVLYIPDTISSEQASALLGDGIAAFNSVEKLPTGSKIAVLGTNNSAFLTVQFAKKVFNHHVTLLSLNSSEGVAEAFGADAADVYSLQTVKKYEEKFDALIITEVVIPELAHPLQSLAMRTGKVFFTNHFCYHNTLVFFDLIVCKVYPIQVSANSKA
jgi:D-arabinose 1-dehydrogenase-like Zn-dependent alcohol dehydrogenase